MAFGWDCLCWCQVRPVACALSCCGCIVHDHPVESGSHEALFGEPEPVDRSVEG